MLGIWLKCCRSEMTCDKTSKNIENFFVWRIGAIPLVFLASIPLAFENIVLATWSPIMIPILLGAVHLGFSSKLRHLKLINSSKKAREEMAKVA